MPAAFSTFTTLLSEIPTALRQRIPIVVLYPLTITATVLAAILVAVLGPESIGEYWRAWNTIGKLVMATVLVLTLLLLAYALGNLQGVVSRLFEGQHALLAWSAGWSGQLERHRQEWRRRRQEWQGYLDSYDTITSALDSPDRSEPATALVATRRLLRYQIIAPGDIALRRVETPPAGGLVTPGEALGRMIVRAAEAGAALTREGLVAPPATGWPAALAILPLTIKAASVPDGLAAGESVRIFDPADQRWWPEAGGAGGYMVLGVQAPPQPAAAPAAEPVIRVTIAAERGAVGPLAGHAPDLLVLPHPSPPHPSPPPAPSSPAPPAVETIAGIDAPPGGRVALLFGDTGGAVAVVFGGTGGADGHSVEIPGAARRRLPEALRPQRAIPLPPGLRLPDGWEVWPRAARVDFFCEGAIPAADTAAGMAVGLVLGTTATGAATFYRATGLIEAVLPGERRRIVLLVRDGARLPTRDAATVRAVLSYSASRLEREFELLEERCDSWGDRSAGPQSLAVTPADVCGYAEAAMRAGALRELLEGVAEALRDPHQDIGLQTWKARSRAIDGRLVALMERVQRDLLYRVDEGHRYFRLYYPADFAAVAPTAIGNVLRAVDSYTDSLYGLDAALVLQRLLLVVSSERQKAIADFRERLDFLQWSWLGTVVVGIVGGGLAFAGGQEWLAALVVLLAFPIAWWLLYPAALAAAVAYADQLRILFDSERGAVLEALGVLPTGAVTQETERGLWGNLGQWWEYGAAPDRYTLKGSKGTDKK